MLQKGDGGNTICLQQILSRCCPEPVRGLSYKAACTGPTKSFNVAVQCGVAPRIPLVSTVPAAGLPSQRRHQDRARSHLDLGKCHPGQLPCYHTDASGQPSHTPEEGSQGLISTPPSLPLFASQYSRHCTVRKGTAPKLCRKEAAFAARPPDLLGVPLAVPRERCTPCRL